MGSPRWLTEDEQRAWRAHLQATRLLMDAVDAQLQRDAGLSHADYEILVRLSEAPGRQLRMSQLADALLFSRSRLSHAAARLERIGWVRRQGCTDDARGTLALLTDDGWDKLVATAPGHVAAVREHLVDRLSPVQLAQLQQIAAAVRRAAPPTPGPASAPRDADPGEVDLTEQWRAEQLMEAVLAATTEQALIATDRSGRITLFNAGAERMLGHPAEQALGRDVAALLHDPDELAARAEALGVPVESVVAFRAQREGADTQHWTYRRRDGSTLTVALSVTVLRHPQGAMEGYLGVAVDLTGQQQREQQLSAAAEQARHRAAHDPLTGLPHRAVLADRLQQALAAHHRSGRVSGLLYLDVDQLKTVNDTHGHAAGDALLVEVGRRLVQVGRDVDLCARLGGDEFAVLLDDVRGRAELDTVIGRIQERLRAPLPLASGAVLRPAASIGGTLTRPDDTPEQVLGRADADMYRRKAGQPG